MLNEDKLEIAGGKPHQNKIEKIFSLNRGRKYLNALLKKDNSKIFKETKFLFPYAPSRDMSLDVHVCVASAGGLAQVELIPEEKEFLGGKPIFLDYNNMEDTETIPDPKLGFPPVESIPVDPKDSRILQNNNFQRICNDFHSIGVYSSRYRACVKNLRDELRKPINFLNNARVQISGRIVNQDGKTGTPEGQKVINKISKKLGNDLTVIVFRGLDREIERVICSAATWLFGAAPPEVYSYLRKKLEPKLTRKLTSGEK